MRSKSILTKRNKTKLSDKTGERILCVTSDEEENIPIDIPLPATNFHKLTVSHNNSETNIRSLITPIEMLNDNIKAFVPDKRHYNRSKSEESSNESGSVFQIDENGKQSRQRAKRFSKFFTRKHSQYGETTLQNAVNNYDYPLLERILTNENEVVDINYLYPPGVSILHQACVLGDFDIVKLILDKGADVNLKTWTQITPTKLATTFGHFDIARLLLLNGAPVDDVKNGCQLEI